MKKKNFYRNFHHHILEHCCSFQQKWFLLRNQNIFKAITVNTVVAFYFNKLIIYIMKNNIEVKTFDIDEDIVAKSIYRNTQREFTNE